MFYRDEFVNNLFKVGVGSIVSRIVLVLGIPVIVRLFSVEDVAAWQLFWGIALMLQPVACLGYPYAIVLARDDNEALSIERLCILVALGFSICLAFVWAIAGDYPKNVFPEFSVLRSFLWLVPPVVFSLGISSTFHYSFARRQQFGANAWSRVIGSSLMVLLPIALSLFNWTGVESLIFGVCCSALGAAFFMVMMDRRFGLTKNKESTFRFMEVARRYRVYPLYMVPYSFIGQFSKRMILFILASFASMEVTGYYAIAYQLVFMPVMFITSALQQVFFPKFAREYDSASMGRFILRVLHGQNFLITPLLACFVVFHDRLIYFVLGSDWMPAAPFAAWLSIAAYALFFTAWLDRVFDVAGRQRLAVVLQVIYDVISLGGMVLSLVMGATPICAIGVYALLTFIYNAFWLCIAFRCIRLSLTPLLKVGGLVIGLGCGCFLANLLFDGIGAPFGATLGVTFSVFISIGLTILWVRRFA